MPRLRSRRRALQLFVGAAAALGAIPLSTAPPAHAANVDYDLLLLNALQRAMAKSATPSPLTSARLAGAVSAALNNVTGTFGIAVKNLKTGLSFTQSPDDFFPSASLYKVAVMYEVFRQNAAGALSLDEALTVQDQDLDEGTDDEQLSSGQQVSVRDALQLMISISDNGAAHILADRVGWEQLNVSMANLGLNHTRVPVGDWKAQMTDWRNQDSCTSPGDMLTFFDRLYHHQLVNAAASDQMVQLLLGDEINDRIPANLPPGTKVAHKIGNLAGTVNDAGIVYSPGADFVIVMLSHDADEDGATAAEATLARSVYDLFNS